MLAATAVASPVTVAPVAVAATAATQGPVVFKKGADPAVGPVVALVVALAVAPVVVPAAARALRVVPVQAEPSGTKTS